MIQRLLIILFSSASGIFYRLGGLGNGGKERFPKIPTWWFNTKIRDIGIPLIYFSWCIIYGIPVNRYLILSCTLLAFSLSTYFKKSGDPQPKHWFAHGLAIGLSAIPLYWCGVSWQPIILRAIVLSSATVFIGSIPNDDISELGRGFIIIATLLMLR